MPQLLLDIGNSRVKWGVLDHGVIGQTGDIALEKFPVDLPRPIDSAMACNVAGTDVASIVSAAVKAQCGVSVSFVHASAEAAGVRNGYADPARLGADRWFALIGARAATPNPCLVVDAGTAITLDALAADGQHLGGQILPGLTSMSRALGISTSELPNVDVQQFDLVGKSERFANSTTVAIAQGILGAATGAINQAATALGEDASVILTGGDAAVLQAQLQRHAEYREHLVLEGLARSGC